MITPSTSGRALGAERTDGRAAGVRPGHAPGHVAQGLVGEDEHPGQLTGIAASGAQAGGAASGTAAASGTGAITSATSSSSSGSAAYSWP